MALSISKDELDELAFSPAPEEMRVARELMSHIDGFLTAVVVGPEPIDSSEWLPRVAFGLMGGPAIDRRMELLAEVLLGRCEEILEQVEKGEDALRPLYLPEEQGRPIAEEWAEGFLEGMRLRLELWGDLLATPERMLLTPILLHLRDENGAHLALEAMKGTPQEALKLAAEAIPASAVEIYHYWRQRRGLETKGRPMSFEGLKVGRNEPCPCGSGKKFKRCHGAAA
jgi:uncharacterized protein